MHITDQVIYDTKQATSHGSHVHNEVTGADRRQWAGDGHLVAENIKGSTLVALLS